jgi:Phophatidylserine decarboxylase
MVPLLSQNARDSAGRTAVLMMLAAVWQTILDWAMGTPAGFAAFRDRRINAMLGKILKAWSEFLDSGDSRYVLIAGPAANSPAVRHI